MKVSESSRPNGDTSARIEDMKLTKADYPVIDLKASYGDRYRIKKDECGDQLIPHKWGHFYAHSDTELACFVNGNRKFNLIHEQFPNIRPTQRGDQEIIFIFDPALLPRLATALKASRRRQYSESTLQKMRERAQKARKALVEKRLREESEDLLAKTQITATEVSGT